KENVAPEVKDAKLTSATTIRVNFSEALENYTANPFEVYVDGTKVAYSNIAAVASSGSASYIDITLTDALTDVTKPISVKIKSDAVIKDAVGNKLVTGGTTEVTN